VKVDKEEKPATKSILQYFKKKPSKSSPKVNKVFVED